MYITYKQKTNVTPTNSFEDIFDNFEQILNYKTSKQSINFFKTITQKWDNMSATKKEELYINYKLSKMKSDLKIIHDKIILIATPNMLSHYRTFYVPKHNGDWRRIDEPLAPLKFLLLEIKEIFEKSLLVLPHNSAFAYTKGRCTLDALKEHQQNESKWFLKIDIKDFFPSCNPNFIYKQLIKLFPFSILMEDEEINIIIKDIIKITTLNNGFPQGTPTSPLLTNIIMIPIDYIINNMLCNWQRQHFIYTRYADDICISSKYHFNWKALENEINNIFIKEETPFEIKAEKTRYGSSSGRNWNLGLMLNKDNNITIGYKRKQKFKATIYKFFLDLTEEKPWSKVEAQKLMGLVSYFKKIEPQYIDDIIKKYSERFQTDFNFELQELINAGYTADSQAAF